MIQSTQAMDRPVGGKRGNRRLWLTTAVAVLVLAVGALLFPRVSGWFRADRSFDLARLRVATVERGDLERDLAVQGRVVAAFHPTTFSPASGIVNLHVQAGEFVEEDQVLATVESPELESRLKQEQSVLLSLRSDLDRQRILVKQTMLADRQRVDLASVELEAAQRAMSRAERSRREGIVNEVEFEQAQDDLRRAELALSHAKQNAALQEETLAFEVSNREAQLQRQRLIVDELRRQVDGLAVRAPVAGLVSRLDVNDHDAVAPNQPLITVVDLTAFEIEILVPESYADELTPGTPAEIRYGGDSFAGHVRIVSPEVEGSQVRGFVAFDDPVPAGIRQNQRVSTRLVLESHADVLKLARGPFLETGGGREAYVIEGDSAVLRPIEVGALSLTEIEVIGGLQEGDRVIVSDTTRFEDATRIFLRQ